MKLKQTAVTSDLKLGDTVLFYGMRILLDTAPVSWDGGHGHTVCAWTGTIQNLEEALASGPVTKALLYNDDCEIDGRWTLQGNDLATWTIER